MNSLSQLNSLAAITFDDQRTPIVIFDRPIPMNQTVTINQNDTHSVPVGINIVDIVNPTLASVTYTIDISSQPEATLTWASIPADVSVTTPESGVYTLIGIDSVSDWTALKSPTFTPDPAFTGVFSYTATIAWATGSQSWTVNVTILDITNMTAADDVYYDKNDTGVIAGNPEILDNYSTNWTVTVTPSNINYVSVLSSAGTGGTSSFNTTTKVLTIKGTKTQVNTHLNLISYTITNSATEDFILGYLAINDTTGEGDYKVQNWDSTEYLAATRANDTYSLNTQAAITNGPLITDASYDGSGNYVMTIAPTVPAAVYSMASQGKFYWSLTQTTNTPPALLLPNGQLAEPEGYLEFIHAQTSDLVKYAISNSLREKVYIYSRNFQTTISSNKFLKPDGVTLQTNAEITISGTNSGTGAIAGYTNPTTYYIRDLTGSSFNISNTVGGTAISLTNGTLTGLTFTGPTLLLLNTLTPSSTGEGYGEHFSANSDLTKFAIAARGEFGLGQTTGTPRGAFYIQNADGSGSTRIANISSTDYLRAVKMNSAGTTVAAFLDSGGDAWVYIYDINGSTWSTTPTNTFQGVSREFGKPASNYYDQRGMVFVTDTTLVVTDIRETNYRGTVSIFTKSGGSWSLNVKLTNPLAVDYSFFGEKIKVNSSTQIEVWADAKKHIYSLISGTWTFVSTSNITSADSSYPTTTNGEFQVIGSKVYRNPGSGFAEYSTLSSSSDAVFQAIISANGEYIVGHRPASTSLKYIKAFVKTANDPNASSWNDTTKTLTLQGTREFINSEIDTIQLTPASAYNTNITLTYTLTTPRGDSDLRTQTITYTA